MIISQCAVSGSATMLTMLRQWRILTMMRILNTNHAETAKEDSSKAIPITTWTNNILHLLWMMCDDFFVTLFLCQFFCKVWPVLLKKVLTSCPKSDAISMGWISYNKKSLKILWKKMKYWKYWIAVCRFIPVILKDIRGNPLLGSKELNPLKIFWKPLFDQKWFQRYISLQMHQFWSSC